MTDIRLSQMTGIPYGDNAGRPINPIIGQPYFNGESQRLELYTDTGWNNIVQEVPGVTGIAGAYNESIGSGNITIYGTNFVSGAIAYAIGNNGTEYNATSTTFNSLVELVASFSELPAGNEPYDIKVVNPSNLFGILPDALYVNNTPTWITASGSLGSFIENSSVSVQLSASDSEGTSLVYSLSSGSLPSGLSLSSSGLISGTPGSVSGNTSYTFTISVSDGANTSSRSFSMVVVESGPVWSTPTLLPEFTKNISYNTSLIAIDDAGDNVSYVLQSGSLPTGLTLSTSGVISGTPSTSTNVSFTVRASDSHGAYSDRSFTLPNKGPVWATTTITGGIVGTSYSFTLSSVDDDGLAPVYSLQAGSLPSGLILSSSGVISGTPTTSETKTFTIRSSDENLSYADREFTLTIEPTWELVFTGWDGSGTSFSEGAGVVYENSLILVGGRNSSESSINKVFRLDTDGNKTQLGTIPQNRDEVTAARIGTNIYVTGGAFNNAGGTSNTMYKFDLLNNTSSTMAAPPYTGYSMINGVLTDGGEQKVYSGSGASDQNTGWYAYSPSNNNYSTKASFPYQVTKSSTAYTSYNNIFYLFTTTNTTGTQPQGNERCYKYDPSTNSWTQIASAPNSRVRFAGSVAAPDGTGNIYLYGGGGLDATTSTTYSPDTRSYVYNVNTNTWSRAAAAWDLPAGLSGHTSWTTGGKGTTNYFVYEQGQFRKK